MKAVIMAAGEGSRMRPLTYTIPKPLIEVAGKPTLVWIFEALRPHVDGIVLVVGHLRERIQEHFGEAWEGIPITYVHQAEQRGTGHALQICRDAVAGADRFFVIYGDNITAPGDVARCAEQDLAALAIEVPDPEKYGIFRTDSEGRLTDMVEKPKEPIGNLANAGVYVFDQRIFDELETLRESERGELELTDALLGLAKRGSIQVVDVEDHWLPIGYRDDIAKAEPVLLGRERGPAELLAQRRLTLTALLGLWHHNMDVMLDEAALREHGADAPTLREGETSLFGLVRVIIKALRFVRAVITDQDPQEVTLPPAEETPDLAAARAVMDEERRLLLALVQSADAALLDCVHAVPFGGDKPVYLSSDELVLTLMGHAAWHAGLTPALRQLIEKTGD